MAQGLAIRNGRHGRGVFAERRFAEGDVVETCPTVHVRDSEVTGTLRDYVFASVEPGDVVLALGYGMLYNHSAAPNVEYEQDERGSITFFALRAVEPGDELTIDYGGEWWETRGLQPG